MHPNRKIGILGLNNYVSHQLGTFDAKVTVFYVNGKTQSHCVTGVMSYLQHGERVVRLDVAEDFSDVFYFERESFYITEDGDVLTYLPDTDTPQTRISFHPPNKFRCWSCHCAVDRPNWSQEEFNANPFCDDQCEHGYHQESFYNPDMYPLP